MNTYSTTTTVAAVNCDGNGHVTIELLGLLGDIRSSKDIKNVHCEEYMTKQDIVDRFESITGELLNVNKTKEFLVNAIQSSYEYYDGLVVRVEDEVVILEEKQQVGKEIGFEVPGVKAEIKPAVNTPLYIKEETCDIESKELDKRLLMAQVINAASSNIVKAFISKGMLLSIINKELFGVESLYKNPAMKVNNQGKFTPAEVALAAKTLDELVSDYLIPHKMGYVVKPYYMAWFYKNANLTYKVKGRSYMINTTRKVIVNLTTKRAVPLNKTNCEWLNDGFFVRLAK